MMQLEVADRICGKTQTKDYNSLSITIQYQASCKKLFKVPRTVARRQEAQGHIEEPGRHMRGDRLVGEPIRRSRRERPSKREEMPGGLFQARREGIAHSPRRLPRAREVRRMERGRGGGMAHEGPPVDMGDAADKLVPRVDKAEVRRPHRTADGIRPAIPRLAGLRNVSRRGRSG